MQRNYRLLIAAALLALLILSVTVGFLLAEKNAPKPEPAPTAHAVAASLPTEAVKAPDTPVFKIKLEDDTLKMYSDDTVIKETTISPEVYPQEDITALTSGTVYTSLEAALVDWESMCE